MGSVNQGVSPSPSTHAKQGPHPDNQAVNNNQDNVVTQEPAYAAVHKNKVEENICTIITTNHKPLRTSWLK